MRRFFRAKMWSSAIVLGGLLTVVSLSLGCGGVTKAERCVREKAVVTKVAIYRLQQPDPNGWIMGLGADGSEIIISPKVVKACKKKGPLSVGRVLLLRTIPRGACPSAEEIIGCE